MMSYHKSYKYSRKTDSKQRSQHCDLLERLWEGDKEVEISVSNWEMEPITFPKGTAIGVLEAVELVTAEDPI